MCVCVCTCMPTFKLLSNRMFFSGYKNLCSEKHCTKSAKYIKKMLWYWLVIEKCSGLWRTPCFDVISLHLLEWWCLNLEQIKWRALKRCTYTCEELEGKQHSLEEYAPYFAWDQWFMKLYDHWNHYLPLNCWPLLRDLNFTGWVNCPVVIAVYFADCTIFFNMKF